MRNDAVDNACPGCGSESYPPPGGGTARSAKGERDLPPSVSCARQLPQGGRYGISPSGRGNGTECQGGERLAPSVTASPCQLPHRGSYGISPSGRGNGAERQGGERFASLSQLALASSLMEGAMAISPSARGNGAERQGGARVLAAISILQGATKPSFVKRRRPSARTGAEDLSFMPCCGARNLCAALATASNSDRCHSLASLASTTGGGRLAPRRTF